jgi:hypothetical protein
MATPVITTSNVDKFGWSSAISRNAWGTKYNYSEFTQEPLVSSYSLAGTPTVPTGGGAATGAAGDRNLLISKGNLFEWNVIGTQTILSPSLDTTNGFLNIVQDLTAGDGAEYHRGLTSASPQAFTIGTDPAFFLRCRFAVEDASGCNPLIIGFRKAAAFNATLSSYTDFASIGIVGTANPNTIKIQTQTASGGVTTTDTTQTWADAAVHDLVILVDSAGVVTYQIDGSAPTVTAAFTLANALTVIPFIRFTQAADVTSYVDFQIFECGPQ